MARSRNARQEYDKFVADRSERNARAGRMGNMVMRARYPANVRNKWARKGGRPKDPTIAELRARGLLP